MKKVTALTLSAILAAGLCLTAAAYSDVMVSGYPLSPASDPDVATALQDPRGTGETAFADRSLSAAQLAIIAAARPDTKVMMDITDDDLVLSRTWLDPALAYMNGFIPGGHFGSENALLIHNIFTLFFANDPIYVYELNYKGELPGMIHAAIWVGTAPDTPLYAYTYRSSDNTYKAVHCYTDISGYHHVEYDAGDFLIFSPSLLRFK